MTLPPWNLLGHVFLCKEYVVNLYSLEESERIRLTALPPQDWLHPRMCLFCEPESLQGNSPGYVH